MDGQQNRNVIAAAQQLHFAHAAKSVGIPRSTVIASITASEAEVGYPLFDYEAEATAREATPVPLILRSRRASTPTMVTQAIQGKVAKTAPPQPPTE